MLKEASNVVDESAILEIKETPKVNYKKRRRINNLQELLEKRIRNRRTGTIKYHFNALTAKPKRI